MKCSVIFYGPRDPTKLPAAPADGRTGLLVLMVSRLTGLADTFCIRDGFQRNEDMQRRKSNGSKYRTVSGVSANARVASAVEI